MATNTLTRRLKPIVFVTCLVPAILLVWDTFTGGLGANPIEEVTHTTGDWTLRFLLITLAVTPLRRLTGWSPLIRFRRMLGLFAFFFACLHFSTYVVLDHFFAFDLIIEDVAERKYVTAGFTGFVLLIPLAVTSTQAMIRRLGGKRWNLLHRLIYVSAVAGVVHYLWLVKIDIRPPMIYAAILAVLFGARLAHRYGWMRIGWRSPARAASAGESALRS